MKRPDSIYSQFHLDTWTDGDFSDHAEATRKTVAYLIELEKEVGPLFTPRPLSEYHEDMGPVLWWKFPIDEAPWVGTTNDLGKEVMVGTKVLTIVNGDTMKLEPYDGAGFQRVNVGGWTDYHTHWTPLPKVVAP